MSSKHRTAALATDARSGANPVRFPGTAVTYGYPSRPSPGAAPPSGYSFGPFAPDEQATEWHLVLRMAPTEPLLPVGPGTARGAPRSRAKGNGKILITSRGPSCGDLDGRSRRSGGDTRGPQANPGGSAQGQQSQSSRACPLALHGLRMRYRHTSGPCCRRPVAACPHAADQRQQGLC